jgi:hypothetical protein
LFKATFQNGYLRIRKNFAWISAVLLALMQEESQINRLYAKAILQMRKEMRSRAEGDQQTRICVAQPQPRLDHQAAKMARIARMTLETLLRAVNQHISPTGWSSPRLGRPGRGQGWMAYQAGGTKLSTKLLHS